MFIEDTCSTCGNAEETMYYIEEKEIYLCEDCYIDYLATKRGLQ